MVNVSADTPEQTEARLRQVIARCDFVVRDGLWLFTESPEPPRLTREALAVVRDEQVWSSLVPAGEDSPGAGRFGVFSFHFPPDMDNSGFVGWLATLLKRELGTGVFVVCGSNTARGGVFDHWGCPADVLPLAVKIVEGLRS
ncbi:hypothetical protein Pth03_71710 [Planotetraspora thailandica]|uniref:Uncharacterized protein n=1 Tax=Planotetraspora thailandica TaxID=487172 RepID=A0A8J3Y108_9ACTN|nr:DUF6196 family protein [Planotetraspora thailandica]GII58782.1 hypothetical protein Pth03_71710 [Planotetraspora thailandica]